MKTKEPPCTERYARWCERTEDLFKSSSYSINNSNAELRLFYSAAYLIENAELAMLEALAAAVEYDERFAREASE